MVLELFCTLIIHIKALFIKLHVLKLHKMELWSESINIFSMSLVPYFFNHICHLIFGLLLFYMQLSSLIVYQLLSRKTKLHMNYFMHIFVSSPCYVFLGVFATLPLSLLIGKSLTLVLSHVSFSVLNLTLKVISFTIFIPVHLRYLVM